MKQTDDKVQEVLNVEDTGSGVKAEEVSIEGGEKDEIVIPQQIFQQFNITGAYKP